MTKYKTKALSHHHGFLASRNKLNNEYFEIPKISKSLSQKFNLELICPNKMSK